MLLALLLALPLSSFAAVSPDASGGDCQTKLKIRSPVDIFQEHNVRFPGACPEQNQIDANHECEDQANQLVALYKELIATDTAVCRANKAARAGATRDCLGQASCVQGQKDALMAAKHGLDEEIRKLKSYEARIGKVLDYTTDQIAGGGVDVLHSANVDKEVNGPLNRGGAAEVVKARDNDDAVNRVFKGEDEQAARAIVQGFLRNGASESDISRIKSNIIREPLAVAAAGKQWKDAVVAYRSDLEQTSASLETQSAKLSGSNLNSAGDNTSGNQASSAGDGISGAAKAAQAAQAGAQAMGAAGGAGLSSGSASPSTAAAGDGTYRATGATGATGATALSGDSVKAGGSSAAAVSPSVAAAGVSSSGTAEATGASTSGSGASSLRSQLAARLAAARAAANGKGDAAVGDAPAALKADAKPAAARAPASVAGVSAGGSELAALPSLKDADSLFLPPLIPVASESNENAVKGIVGAWEKSLSGDTVAASPEEIPQASSEPLFGRVRLAHERALRRGSLMRTIPRKL